MQSKLAVLCCTCAAFWLPPAAAQQPAKKHPADPQATVPAPAYTSAFAGYRPLRDEPLATWREVNDEVGRVGGQIGIFGGGHAGHGGGKTVTNTLVPGAAAPQTPPPMQGPGHQGMKK